MVAVMRFLRVDYAGVGTVLKGPDVSVLVRETATAVAEFVPDTVDGEYLETVVEEYATDRASAQVLVKHPYAAAMQAKYGILTRAAGAAGLEVRDG